MAIKYRSNIKISIVMGTTIGVGLCLFLFVGVSAVLTSLFLNGTLQTKTLQWIAPVTHGVISFLGAMIAGGLVEDKKHISSLVCGGVYLGLTTCFALLTADGLLREYWIGAACIAIGCVAASVLNMKTKKINLAKRRGKYFR